MSKGAEPFRSSLLSSTDRGPSSASDGGVAVDKSWERGAADMVDAILVGGPVSVPSDRRHCRVPAVEYKIKLCHDGGYEHFERDALPPGGNRSVVFRWTGRTRIAE
jgi:hypothetical protein